MKKLVVVFVVLGLLLAACGGPAEGPEPGDTARPTIEFKTPPPEPTEAQMKPTTTPVPPPPTPTPRPTATPVPTAAPEEAETETEIETETEATEAPAPLPVSDDMVEIPAGPFTMGSDTGDPEDAPAHETDLPAFKIDRFEVTNAEFATFVEATGYATHAEEAGGRLGEENKMLAVLEEKLAGKDFALAEHEALSKLEAEITQLNYDSQRHQQAKQRLETLEQYDDSKRRLEEAERLLDRERESAAQAGQAVQELSQRLEADRKEQQSLFAQLDALPSVDRELSQAETEFRRLTEEQRQAQQEVGSLKERLKRCEELKAKKGEKEKHLSQARDMETIYKELAQAFGKKGIQAMLIEIALPEIEAEANRLLGRMTDNRMHVRIESQRPSKKGDVIETLDIKIADELGTRSYEMFSGGEAFRIDFAIRIALSKLLTRRAGAPLPTLIIDEGFGTQDIAGIERLKEVINSIQDDFDKILVITHIEELKDAFPTRIEVIKTAEGSTLSLS